MRLDDETQDRTTFMCRPLLKLSFAKMVSSPLFNVILITQTLVITISLVSISLNPYQKPSNSASDMDTR